MIDWAAEAEISARANAEAGRAIDEVEAAGGPAGAVATEVAARGGGTSEDDLRAYAAAAGAAGGAAACAALGAPMLSPLCGTVGGAIGGLVFDAIAGLFGGDEAMEAALAQSRDMDAARAVWRARMADVRDAAWRPLRDFYAENRAELRGLPGPDGEPLSGWLDWWQGEPATPIEAARYARHYLSLIAPAAAATLEIAEQGFGALMWRPEGEVYSGSDDDHERDRRRRITEAMARIEAAAAAVAAAVAGQIAIWATHIESHRDAVSGARPGAAEAAGGGGGVVLLAGLAALGWALMRR